MDRRSRTFSAVLAASITLTCIPITAQQGSGQPSAGRLQAGSSQAPAPRTGEGKGQLPDSQPQPTQQQPAITQRGTEATPLVVKISKSQDEAAQEQAGREEESSSKWWTIWLAGLTVLVGVGQIWMIRKQAAIAARQNTIMEGQSQIMDGQLRATEEAANAAKASADVARETLYLTQGSDVQMRDIEWDQQDRSANGVPDAVVTIKIKNFGKTPALRLECDGVLGIPGSLIKNSLPQPAAVTLGADQELSYGFPRFRNLMPAEDLAAVVSGIAKMRCVGSVAYDDVFGRHHRTRFGATYIPGSMNFAIDEYESTVMEPNQSQPNKQSFGGEVGG